MIPADYFLFLFFCKTYFYCSFKKFVSIPYNETAAADIKNNPYAPVTLYSVCGRSGLTSGAQQCSDRAFVAFRAYIGVYRLFRILPSLSVVHTSYQKCYSSSSCASVLQSRLLHSNMYIVISGPLFSIQGCWTYIATGVIFLLLHLSDSKCCITYQQLLL